MELTNGRGVDVVLNALAAEAIPMGLSCLAESGRFIENVNLLREALTAVTRHPAPVALRVSRPAGPVAVAAAPASAASASRDAR